MSREPSGDPVHEAARAARAQVEREGERGKRTAVGTADDLSDAVDSAASELAARGYGGLANAAAEASTALGRLADYLETHSIDDLMREAEKVARRNPLLFAAGGLGLGFALSRYLRTTDARAHEGLE